MKKYLIKLFCPIEDKPDRVFLHSEKNFYKFGRYGEFLRFLGPVGPQGPLKISGSIKLKLAQ